MASDGGYWLIVDFSGGSMALSVEAVDDNIMCRLMCSMRTEDVLLRRRK